MRRKRIVLVVLILVTLFCSYVSITGLLLGGVSVYGGNKATFDLLTSQQRDAILQSCAALSLRVGVPFLVTTLLWVVAFVCYRVRSQNNPKHLGSTMPD